MKKIPIKMMIFVNTVFKRNGYKSTVEKIEKKYGDLNIENYTKYLMDEDNKKQKQEI